MPEPSKGNARGWTIHVCPCGYPLGGTLSAIRLKKCPDCGGPTRPVEDCTYSVRVAQEDEDARWEWANVELRMTEDPA